MLQFQFELYTNSLCAYAAYIPLCFGFLIYLILLTEKNESASDDATKIKDDALAVLTAYLKSLKPPTEEDMLAERLEKLEKSEADYVHGKTALQTLGKEIQVNMKRLKQELKATPTTNQVYRKQLRMNIEKVTTGSHALIQIGRKLASHKEAMRVERQLLQEDQEKLHAAAEKQPLPEAMDWNAKTARSYSISVFPVSLPKT